MTDPITRALSAVQVDDADVIVWAIVRNFRLTAKAWLDHHRRLGVTKFVLLDDRSDDGTRELLMAEPDCLVVESNFRFGDMVGGKRVNSAIKNSIIGNWLIGRWSLHIDSDEFLFLPERYGGSLPRLIATLDRFGLASANAVLVDFYPDAPGVLFETPREEYDPFAVCSHFDRGPYVIWRDGKEPFQVHGGIRETLFRRYGMIRRISTTNVGPSARKPEMAGGGLLAPSFYRAAPDDPLSRHVREAFKAKRHLASAPWVFKTPLAKWRDGQRFVHDHFLEAPADTRVCIALAHFKFTPGLAASVDAAKARKQYTQGSIQYLFYARLLDEVRKQPSLLHRKSVAFRGPADLEAAALAYDRFEP